MKLFLIGLLVAVVGYYLYVFVLSKPVEHASITNYKKDKIKIELTDSYYFITSINKKYSIKKDTLYLSCKRSSLANIFYSNKLGYKITEVERSTKVITFCGASTLIKNLPIDKTEECNSATLPEKY